MKCPLCGEKTKISGDMREDGTESCPNNDYSYTHSYGTHQEHFDIHNAGMVTLSIGWYYSASEEELKKVDAMRKSFIDYANFCREKYET